MTRKRISVIVPAYNESDCVDELARRLAGVFDAEPNYDFECVVIENGSTDDTYEKLMRIHEADPRFKILKLARNFRMDGGITAGLSVIEGDACVIMTADLQDPPELIHDFLRKWEEGYENVYGLVTARHGTSPIRKMNSKLFYWVANKSTNGLVTKNASDFRLVDRKVYTAVRQMDERNRFVRGLFCWVGFKTVAVPMERPPRHGGESKAYTFQVIELAFKGIFAHSYAPLKFISLFGFGLTLVSILFTIFVIVQSIVIGVPFSGYGTIMCTMLIGFGVLSLLIGVIGEYLALVYEEVKHRPNFIVSEKVGL